MTPMTGWRLALRGHRRWRAFASLVAALVVLGVVGWWASHQGYIALETVTCTMENFQDPVPSFERLVTKYGKSPYCARLVRDETWF